MMESTEEKSGMLHQILPPRLEDAGLEDPALPPESIHQAFLQAAAAVKSRAASIFSLNADADDDAHGCVIDPWPDGEGAVDSVVGIDSENEPPPGGDGDCGAHDVVVDGGVKLGEEDIKPCVDDLRGLDIKDDVKKGGEDDKEKKKPTLVEGFV